MSFPSYPLVGLFASLWWIPILITLLVHIAFAAAVLSDSETRWRETRRRTFLVGGPLWALATLGGGVMVAAAYWLIHYSTLSQTPSRGAESASASMGASPGNSQ